MNELNPEFVLHGYDYLSPSFSLVVANAQKVYSTFVEVLRETIYDAFIGTSPKWEYERDAETGLEILKANKHPKSLDRLDFNMRRKQRSDI